MQWLKRGNKYLFLCTFTLTNKLYCSGLKCCVGTWWDGDTSHVNANLTWTASLFASGLTFAMPVDVSPLWTSLKKRNTKHRNETIRPYFTSVWWHDEICLYAMLLKKGMPLMAEAWLHLIVPIQTFQGGPCDVHLSGSTRRADTRSLGIKLC